MSAWTKRDIGGKKPNRTVWSERTAVGLLLLLAVGPSAAGGCPTRRQHGARHARPKNATHGRGARPKRSALRRPLGSQAGQPRAHQVPGTEHPRWNQELVGPSTPGRSRWEPTEESQEAVPFRWLLLGGSSPAGKSSPFGVGNQPERRDRRRRSRNHPPLRRLHVAPHEVPDDGVSLPRAGHQSHPCSRGRSTRHHAPLRRHRLAAPCSV